MEESYGMKPPAVDEADKEAKGQAASPGFFKRNGKTVAAIAVVGAAVAAITYMILCFVNPLGNMTARFEPDEQVCETVTLVEDASVTLPCAHEWRDDYRIEHVEATTHEVEHPATYATVTVERTVCNVCGEAIDGKTAEHKAETGHEGYTTSVPVGETVMQDAAWIETVVDVPAEDVLVYAGRVCKLCGEPEQGAGPEAE